MNLAGWIVMLISIGTVSLLLVWSIYKVLSGKRENGLKRRQDAIDQPR